MSVSLKLSEMCSLALSYTNACVTDSYRHYYREDIVVKTKSGPVNGYKIASSFDYEYINFLGIPYAKPPVGELRFKDPQPFEPSNKVINKKFGRRGSQACQSELITQRSIGTEDCLHLSVYTHDIKPKTLKPVMVWIHGGAFIFGSNSKDFYNPEFLMRSDIVLIAINYRLGAFGFVTFNDRELGIPGNAGLRDQVMALKWIKENCMYFGGDPDNITLFGGSAGAVSISMHMVSDFSRGLFHKAIMMSGNLYMPWAISPITNWTQRVANKLGWDGEGGDKSCLSVLQRSSHHAIIKAQDSILTWDERNHYTYFPFSPVIEPYESAQCFLSQHPRGLISSAWSKDMPTIIGSCSEEGLLPYKNLLESPYKVSDIKLETTIPHQEFNIDIDSEQCRAMAKQLKKFYFGYSSLTLETILVYCKILNDRLFLHPTHRMILSRVKKQNAPTYLLRFNFESTFSMTKKLFAGQNVPGVCHGDDCAFYFRTAFGGPVPSEDSDEWKTIERMCGSFTSFAQTGNPNDSSIAPIQWEPVSLEISGKHDYKYKCLNVSKEVSYIDLPEYERMQYWDQIFQDAKHNIV